MANNSKFFSFDEVQSKTLEYFNGDKLATTVFMNKYCLRDKEGNFVEQTPDDMHKRIASEFARIEAKFGGGLSEEEILNYISGFKYIVPQGSPMYGIGNDYVQVSLSNCVVVENPEDTVSSICDTGKDLANLFKRRCGVGLDISDLRPDGAIVNNSAKTTTGAWSFADFYSYVCRMIGQNGRRGALMISMNVNHPDIEKFIEMKHDLTKVTGANVSVKITDDFMAAVKNDEEYTLSWTSKDGSKSVERVVQAKDIWNKIVNSATKTAEPGILMWDNITKNLPAHEYEDFKTRTTNPCGEIPLSAGDSCRLISINLSNFVSNKFSSEASFDFEAFDTATRAAMRLCDDLVELEIEKINGIMEACDTKDERVLWGKLLAAAEKGRRTGLGTHGLADCIANLKMKYDEDDAIEMMSKIYSSFRNSAYSESINLAKERGAFPVYDAQIESENLFINRLPENIKSEMKKHGRRNISILTNAPTGSVSIMSQTSSGIEPVFKNSYIRRRKLNHNENIEHDFVDELGDKWVEYKVYTHNVKNYLNTFNTTEVPEYFVEADSIDWVRRVKVQSVIQENIDHSISSTINLPAGTSPDTVSELYLKGWELGLKGITVYVDGSRSGVLITEKKEESKEEFPQHTAPKRPSGLSCDVHKIKVGSDDWVLLVGLMDGKPYEVIGGLSNYVNLPTKYTSGTLVKNARKTRSARYDLILGEGSDEMVVKDIVKIFDNPDNEVLTRMISLSLRHGASINYVVEQLKKDKHSSMFSFNKCIARVLKKYIKDGTKASSEHCPSCESKQLIYQDGCVQCQDCGWSGCS
jgi:ribonucleoside-diphosphate reductase alpha chain